MTVSFYNCIQINTVSKSPTIRQRLRSEGGKISVVLQRDILPVAAKQASSRHRPQSHGAFFHDFKDYYQAEMHLLSRKELRFLPDLVLMRLTDMHWPVNQIVITPVKRSLILDFLAI